MRKANALRISFTQNGTMSESTYFQKGLGLKAAVAPTLAQTYHSRVVDRVIAR